MSRVKLEMPNSYTFSTEYEVTVADINYGNHLANDRLMAIIHEARLRYFKQLGYKDELSFGNGIGIVMADAAIIYKSEAYHGDILEVSLTSQSPSPFGFEMYYTVNRNSDSTEIAQAKTGIVFYNYNEKKVSKIPDDARRKLGLN